MDVRKSKIQWSDQYSNDPTLQILVDEIPEDLIYRRVGCMYFAEKDGFVNFYYYQKPGEGYGSRSFNIRLQNEDGTIEDKVLKGPWSSNCASMNEVFPHSIPVAITDDLEVFNRGYTFYAGAITIDKAIEAVRHIQGVGLIRRTGEDGSVNYLVTKIGFTRMSDDLEIVCDHSLAWDVFRAKDENRSEK